MPDHLRLLLVSDVHDDVDALESLVEAAAREHVDVVLFPGDFTMMPNPIARGDPGWTEPPAAEVAQYIEKMHDVLDALRRIRRSARLIFVPGNHDPPALFNSTSGDVSADNAHARLLPISSDLLVVGWGGAVEARADGVEVWSAYPWREKDLLGAGLSKLSRDVNALPASAQAVLLTHPGPDRSQTTIVTGADPNSLVTPGVRDAPIRSGSAALEELLVPDAMQRRVVLQVHGHTHQGCGLARVGAVPVLNPGSLRFTRTYALASLARDVQGRWMVASTEIRTLDIGKVAASGDTVPEFGRAGASPTCSAALLSSATSCSNDPLWASLFFAVVFLAMMMLLRVLPVLPKRAIRGSQKNSDDEVTSAIVDQSKARPRGGSPRLVGRRDEMSD